MELSLTPDEIRIVTSAINWTLHLEFSRSTRPNFRSDEVQALELVHAQLCFALHDNRDVKLSARQLRIEPAAPLDCGVVQNLIRCVKAFDAEVGHSPAEVKIVTNVSISVLKALLIKLEQFGDA